MATTEPLVPNVPSQNGIIKISTYVVLAILGSIAIAISAKIKVPMWPVDMSLQTLTVFAIAATYGFRLGLATILLYLAEGAIGLPVFQGTPERGIGIAYMIGSTGGYLVGYVLMTGITGWASDRGWWKNPVKLAAAMLVGEVVMLACGAIWLAHLFGTAKAFEYGVGPFILPDLLKVGIAAGLASVIGRAIKRLKLYN